MTNAPAGQVAIVDYGLGNLFSVKRACEQAGMQATITSDKRAILETEAVLLPGVGAFGDAMHTLRTLDLAAVLKEVAASGKPLVGICLGMQLLMSESSEFGRHKGLDIVAGSVVRFNQPRESGREIKVPEIGWNRIYRRGVWEHTLLTGVTEGEYMYFVHSYVVQLQASEEMLSVTRYGDNEFCSSLQKGSVFACQFHPERSGLPGLKLYHNLAARLSRLKHGETA